MANRRPQDAKFTLPFPFVEWSSVLRAKDPARDVTRSRARSLREHGLLSSGVTVTRHDDRGFRGRGTYNSILWVWAERCARADLPESAVALREAGRALEEQFAAPFESYLAHHDIEELPAAPFFGDVMRLTARALAGCHALELMVVASGKLGGLDESFGRVTGLSPLGRPTVVDLPARMLIAGGFHPGADLWVVERVLGEATLLEVDRAVSVALPVSVARRLGWAQVIGLPTSTTSDGELAGAERYAATAALLPSSSHWDDLVDAAVTGQLPVRRLRLAG